MPPKKTQKKETIQPKMMSVRQDQHDRIQAIAEKEGRSMRTVLERMLDKYEGITGV